MKGRPAVLTIEEAFGAVALEAGAYRDLAFLLGWHGDDICKADATALKAAVVALCHAAVKAAHAISDPDGAEQGCCSACDCPYGMLHRAIDALLAPTEGKEE